MYFEAGGIDPDIFWKFEPAELDRFYRGYKLRVIANKFNNLNLSQDIGVMFSEDSKKYFEQELTQLNLDYDRLHDSTFDEIKQAKIDAEVNKRKHELQKEFRSIQRSLMQNK